MHRSATLSTAQKAALAGAGPVLDKLIIVKAKNMNLAESMLSVVQAFSDSRNLHGKLRTVSCDTYVSLTGSDTDITPQHGWVAWSGQALSLPLLYNLPDGEACEFVTLLTRSIQSISLSPSDCAGDENVRSKTLPPSPH